MIRLLATLGMIAAFAFPVYADETETPHHTVEMWNKDPDDRKRRMVFSDEIIVVQPGHTIQFLATDKGHNVQFIDGPDGVDLPKKSRISKDVDITLNEEGVYVYVCTPHATMGMIGIVVVGELTEEGIAAVKDAKLRGKSKKKFKELLAELP